MRQRFSRFFSLLQKGSGPVLLAAVGLALALSGAGCGGDAIRQYVCETTAADEDYVDFGTMEGFTAQGDWAVIEKVKLPTDFATGGWHVFRGKAWEDKPGDLAISLRADQVHGWLYDDATGWHNVIYYIMVELGRWYTICLQYEEVTETLHLYVDGALQDSVTGVTKKDDGANTNKLFFGGQDVDPDVVPPQGELYSEADIVIAHQAWFQRLLTAPEIADYDGTLNFVDGTGLFFETNIGNTGITDASGNGHDGSNGNTPEFYLDTM
jgi:hypothetical protein